MLRALPNKLNVLQILAHTLIGKLYFNKTIKNMFDKKKPNLIILHRIKYLFYFYINFQLQELVSFIYIFII